MLIVAPVVLTVVIVARIAEQPESYMSWGVFAALLVSGVTTVLQAVRVGRIGVGHVLIMGTSGAFIAVCVAALVKGGPSTMASLIVVSSLFQFLMAWRLSLLRRIFTPVVSGVRAMDMGMVLPHWYKGWGKTSMTAMSVLKELRQRYVKKPWSEQVAWLEQISQWLGQMLPAGHWRLVPRPYFLNRHPVPKSIVAAPGVQNANSRVHSLTS